MAIVRADLKTFRSETFNDTSSNGGRMSAVELSSGVVGNVFPDATEAERTAGSQKFRKLFFKNSETTGLTLFNSRLFLELFTPAEDRVYFFQGTQTDIQSDLTGSENRYGSGQLNADVSAGATSIDVAVEDGATTIFRNGEKIRISDCADIDATGCTTEIATINGTPTVLADVVTIPLASGLNNSFVAANTRVASILEFGDLEPTTTAFTVTSGAGTYDDTTYPVQGDNQGTIEQNWTLTFTSATNFDITGDTVGNQGTGNISSNTAPTNSDFGTPYWTLLSAGFGGTFTSGDTITFTTSPASIPTWVERVIPAGAASFSGNEAIIVFDGESA